MHPSMTASDIKLESVSTVFVSFSIKWFVSLFRFAHTIDKIAVEVEDPGIPG